MFQWSLAQGITSPPVQRFFIHLTPAFSPIFSATFLEGQSALTYWHNEEPIEQLFQRHNVLHLRKAFVTAHPLLDHVYEMTMSTDHNLQDITADFSALPEVVFIEPTPTFSTSFIPDDYEIFSLDYLDVIGAPAAWDISQGSADITIAIIDEGIMTDHEDLWENIWINEAEIPDNGLDDDNNGFVDDVSGYDVASEDPNPNPDSPDIAHGTLVAGCAAATTNNGIGLSSIGFHSRLIPVKASSSVGEITHALRGLDYAIAAGADIVNFSFGSTQFSQTFANLIQVAHEHGIIMVAAAGNDGADMIQFPAQYDFVINVGFTTLNDKKASASNFGPSIDLMAPGTSLWVLDPNEGEGTYNITSGSSLASPIVAGLIGLMKSIHPCLDDEDAITILQQTAVDIDSLNPGFEGLIGKGRINAASAVAASRLVEPIAGFLHSSLQSCGGKVEFAPDSLAAIHGCDYEWRVLNASGELIFSFTGIDSHFLFS